MCSTSKFTGIVAAVAVSLVCLADASPQLKRQEIAGAVQLQNGMILYGLCDSANTIYDVHDVSRRLELRQIDQGFRTYFVSNRRSEAPTPDTLAVPRHDFRLIQKRTSQGPLNYEIGLHGRSSFQPDGRSTVTLHLEQGKTLDVDIGITAINSERVTVDGLSHRWQFGMSMATVPETILYAGPGAPSLLTSVRGFAKSGETQLNMAQMLLEAEKFNASKKLVTDIEAQFPDLKGRCERLTNKWNDEMARRVLEELTRMRETGKYRTARNYARQWPEHNLTPFVRVKAKQFLDGLEQEARQLDSLRESLSGLVGQIEDEQLRRQTMQVWTELSKELDQNTLPRLTAFSFAQLDETLAPEAKLALAASGLFLGVDAAFDNFPEVFGLFQIRFLLQDFLSTTDDEATIRNSLLDEMRKQEGYSVERVALLLQHLQPTRPLRIYESEGATNGTFSLADDSETAGCLGRVPPEYSATRRYPVIIACPRGGLTAEETMRWWARTADRDGYIVIVPSLYAEDKGTYDASAIQHRKMLNLISRLKTGLSIDDDRLFIAGHGMGGEAAMDIGTAHPDLFAGVISIGSLGRKHLSWTSHNSTSLPWYVVVGSRQPGWSTRLRPLLEKLFKRPEGDRREFSDVLFVRYDERGFESYSEELPNLFRWLNLQRRSSLPNQIEAKVLRSTDRSWFWLNLDSVPDKNVSLDEPSTANDRPAKFGRVSAKLNTNLIRLAALPADATLWLSPGLPEVDLSQPFTVINVRGRTQKLNYEPSTRDLLEHFRERRDRQRLCFMKVHVSR